MKYVGLLIIAGFLINGCLPSTYGMRVIDKGGDEIYLSFAKGTTVNIGEVYSVYHMQQSSSGGGSNGGHGSHSGHGGGGESWGGGMSIKHEMGRVQVVQIADEQHAFVKVLSGTVEDGLQAEKVEE